MVLRISSESRAFTLRSALALCLPISIVTAFKLQVETRFQSPHPMTFNNSVAECDNVSFSIVDAGSNSTRPYELIFVPFQNTSQTVAVYNFTDDLKLSIPFPYPDGTTVVPLARDPVDGAIVGVQVTDDPNYAVTPSYSSDASCLLNPPSRDFSFSSSPAAAVLVAGNTSRLSWNSSDTRGNINFFQVSSDGTVTFLQPFGTVFESSNATITFDWIPTSGEFTIVASDDRGVGSGGALFVNVNSPQAQSPVCVFPMNGGYSKLQRALFYLLLVVGFVPALYGYAGPLLGVGMIFSAAICIHAFVLLAIHRQSNTVDLDAMPVFQILVVSAYGGDFALALLPFHNPAYGVFALLWTVLSLAGMFSAGYALKFSAPAFPCAPQTVADGLIAPMNLTACAARCALAGSPIREAGTAFLASQAQLGVMNDAEKAAYFLVPLGAVGAIVYALGKLGMLGADKEDVKEYDMFCVAACNPCQGVAAICGPVGFIVQGVLGELQIRKSGVDYPGPFGGADQWTPWVTLAIALFVSGVPPYLEWIGWVLPEEKEKDDDEEKGSGSGGSNAGSHLNAKSPPPSSPPSPPPLSAPAVMTAVVWKLDNPVITRRHSFS